MMPFETRPAAAARAPRITRVCRRFLALLMAAIAVAMLGGCGGGGDLASTGSGGSGIGPTGTGGTSTAGGPGTETGVAPPPVSLAMVKTYASGPIQSDSGLVVAGVRFDTNATVVIDDTGLTRSVGELARGMVVEVKGEVDVARSNGAATEVRVVRQLVGPVAAVDRTTASLTVFGTKVTWSETTAWGDAAGPASLATDGSVEVWGFVDAGSGSINATRIEFTASDGTAGGRATATQVTGRVTAYDPARQEVTIGAMVVDLSMAVHDPTALLPGTAVSVSGVEASNGRIRAARVWIAPRDLRSLARYAIVQGRIERVSSIDRFALDAFSVEASRAVAVNAIRGTVRAGAVATVAGRIDGNSLVADEVTVHGGDGATNAPSPPPPGTDGGAGPGGAVGDGRGDDDVADPTPPPTTGGCAARDRLRYVVDGWRYAVPYCRSAWRIVTIDYPRATRASATLWIEEIATGQRLVVPATRVTPPGGSVPVPGDAVRRPAPVTHSRDGWTYETDYSSETWTFVSILFPTRPRTYANAIITLQNTLTRERIQVLPSKVTAPDGVGGITVPTWPTGIVPNAFIHIQAGWAYVSGRTRDRWKSSGIVFHASRADVTLILEDIETGTTVAERPWAAISPSGVTLVFPR